MKLAKFLTVGCVAALCNISPALAASSEDFDLSNPACVIDISDTEKFRLVNVNYIRLLEIEKDDNKELKIGLASNYSNASSIKINYPTKEHALKALTDLRDKINDCQYDAAEKRAARKKKQ